MAYPNSGSTLDGTTRTALSTQVIIMVNNEPVGAIQSFQETQNRTNKRVAEVGTDGVIEIVPQSFATVTLAVNRIVFDGLSLPEAFSRGFQNIHAQRISFDIVVIDQYTGTGDDAVITTYHGCWFSNLSKTFSVQDYTIAQSGNIDVEYVSTVRAGEAVADSQGAGGGRQISGIQRDIAEGQADSGVRRGALDFPGLISAAF
jgi:hypothetical protein